LIFMTTKRTHVVIPEQLVKDIDNLVGSRHIRLNSGCPTPDRFPTRHRFRVRIHRAQASRPIPQIQSESSAGRVINRGRSRLSRRPAEARKAQLQRRLATAAQDAIRLTTA
jgi:hypothetical protein